ncbi:class I SAM-dependent methyltransferase [Protaetiibacter mangrovi]|uniref:Class I SAM-dependent methyltransferase n=1 Tax=Protaetiibacter mangrovi TaxID=2970926 RepID=A0ABT1ZFG0_9MICO|nr:class I SAM-dependent methyltransferase [Protaetiibacter mangrovi]MCS0499456.1 class I SAM-dependent methyltransferase [Protaetiibacter mangrovi]TPX04228.1 class I SAM-dependent methyltransferase [Schumannella luteola]
MSGARDDEERPYTDWKRWGLDAGFGVADAGDHDLFTRELRSIEKRTRIQDVVEIGYGNGTFLGYCRQRGWAVTGVELLPELREAAIATGYPAVADDEVDTLPEHAFDLVAAFDVFEHIDPTASIEFLRSLARRLRPEGAIILRFPNADSSLGNPFQNGDPTHVNAIGTLKLDFYAQQAGLEVVEFRGTRRRGFRTSPIHGIHRLTAAPIAIAAGAVRRAIHFPDLRVVLSSGNVVAILRPSA